MSSDKRIMRAILGVSGIAVFSKILGFVREMVIAERFGTSRQYDILLIGIVAPVFFNLVITNATNFLIVPFLSRKMQDSRSDVGWRSFWSLLNTLGAIAALLVVLIVMLAPILVRLSSQGLEAESFAAAVRYCRIIAVLVFFGFLESFLRSVLNVKKEFVYPATGTLILNVVAIATIYIFSGELSVLAILVGLLAGTALQVLFLFFKLVGFGITRHFHSVFFGADTRELFSIGGMVVAVELLSRTYFMIDRYFASDLSAGVVSALNYGSLLVMLPVSVAGLAIAAVTFPYLSDRAADNRLGGIAHLLGSTVRLSLVVGVPCGLFYLAFARELTAAVFLRGAFNFESLEMTSRILTFLVPHLICLFLYSIFIQACYASGRQNYVLGIAVVSIAIKILTTYFFKNLLGYPGIALATSVVEILTLIMLSAVLIRDGNMTGLVRHGATIFKIAAASLPMIPAAILIRRMPDFGPGISWLSKFRIVPAFAFSLIGFLIIGYFLRIEEVRRLIDKIRGAAI